MSLMIGAIATAFQSAGPAVTVGPDLLMSFDNGAKLTDDGKNSITVTETNNSGGTTHNTSSKFGYGIQGNNSDQIEVPGADLKLGSGEFTIELWGMRTNQGSSMKLIGCYDTSTNNRSWGIFASGNNVVGFRYSSNGTSNSTLSATTVPAANQWVHIAVTRDASNVMRIFINGVMENSVTFSGNFHDAGSTPVHIAADILNSPMNSNIHLDDVRIHIGECLYDSDDGFFPPGDLSLYKDTILDLRFRTTEIDKDSSKDNRTLTAVGSPTEVSWFSRGTNVLGDQHGGKLQGLRAAAGGSGNGYTVPASSDFAFTGEFTIEGYATKSATGNDVNIIGSWDAASDERGFLLHSDGNDGINFSLSVNGTSSSSYDNSFNSRQSKSLTHYAVSRDASDVVRCYENGEYMGKFTLAGTVNAGAIAIELLSIDGDDSSSDSLISMLRVIAGRALYTSETYIQVPGPNWGDGALCHFMTGDAANNSTSAGACKSLYWEMNTDVLLTGVAFRVRNADTHQYEVQISELNASATTIASVLATRDASVTISGNDIESPVFIFDEPVLLESGKRYAASLIRTDGVAADPAHTCFDSSPSTFYAPFTHIGAGRTSNLTPGVGDDLSAGANSTSTLTCSLLYTPEV